MPLHLAAEHGASVALVGRLLQHHPHAAAAKDSLDNLPLHLALGAGGEKIKASCEAIGMILAAHPQVRCYTNQLARNRAQIGGSIKNDNP